MEIDRIRTTRHSTDRHTRTRTRMPVRRVALPRGCLHVPLRTSSANTLFGKICELSEVKHIIFSNAWNKYHSYTITTQQQQGTQAN